MNWELQESCELYLRAEVYEVNFLRKNSGNGVERDNGSEEKRSLEKREKDTW